MNSVTTTRSVTISMTSVLAIAVVLLLAGMSDGCHLHSCVPLTGVVMA